MMKIVEQEKEKRTFVKIFNRGLDLEYFIGEHFLGKNLNWFIR